MLVHSQSLLQNPEYQIQAGCKAAETDVKNAQFTWLDLPKSYPDSNIQFGRFSQPGDTRDSTKAGEELSYRVNFPKAFHSQPKVATFFGRVYVNKARNYRAQVYATDIDKSGFTMKIQASGEDPAITTSFIIEWFAHPADSRSVESGKFDATFMSADKQTGTESFAGKKWDEALVVLAGISMLDFREQQQLAVRVSASNVTNRSMQWTFEADSTTSFGLVTGQYVALA